MRARATRAADRRRADDLGARLDRRRGHASRVVAGRPASSSHAATLAEIGAHPQSTVVFDRQNRPAFSFFVEQRIDVPLDRVSPHMIDALLRSRIDASTRITGSTPSASSRPPGATGARGRIVEGGSTLTQQLARLEHAAVVCRDVAAGDFEHRDHINKGTLEVLMWSDQMATSAVQQRPRWLQWVAQLGMEVRERPYASSPLIANEYG